MRATYIEYVIRRHARKRCRQRLGIKLTTKLEKQIVNAVESGKYEHIKNCKKPSRVLIDVDITSQIIRIVYCRTLKQVITVYNRNWKSDVR